MKMHGLTGLLLLLILSGCSFGSPALSQDQQIQAAVEQTVAAIPTYTPYPLSAIPATPTAIDLSGLFCEYQFCIGHPTDMAFFDLSAQHNPVNPSSVSQGLIAAYSSNLFLELLWQNAPGSPDAQFMLDLILDGKVDTRNGSITPMLVGNVNLEYVQITTTATTVLPYGGAAAWVCGGRAFAWKAYTTQPDLAKSLIAEAISRFRCSQQ